MVITEISTRSGAPKKPEKVAAKFLSFCGILGCEKVDIRIDNWKLVTVEMQNQLMAEIKEWFQFPPEFEKSIERAAFTKISKAWRRFKSELTTKFLRKGQSPFNQYGFLDPEVYRRFAEMRSTPEFERLNAKQRELSARNKHPHHLGTGGYEQAEEK